MATPQQQQQKKELKKIADLILRWKIFIIGCLFIALTGGLFIYLKTDKVYQSNSLIVYQQQKITTSKMSPDETRRIEEMVSTVSQQVTSRKNLEEIILKFDLYPELRRNVPIEDVISLMRDHHIEIKSQLGKSDVFSVSYKWTNPRKVVLVTNALASQFIEENLRVREERVTETATYVSDELKMAQEALDKKEKIMRDYKLQHYNEMPEQRESNMERLSALQKGNQEMMANAQALEYTKLLVLEQISLRKGSQGIGDELSGKDSLEGGLQLDGAMNLQRAEELLLELLTKYTENHPKVKMLKARIKQLKEAQQAGLDDSGTATDDTGTDFESDPQLQSLKTQLKEINFKLDHIEEERKKLIDQIAVYKKWVETTPIIEAEWSALTRDYEQLRKHYEFLLANSIAAESAETLERHQKGSQFKIVDPAFLPEKPLQPNFRKIMVFAVALGLGMGFMISVVITFFDSSFRTVEDLEAYLDVPVLCSVPLISLAEEQRKTKIINLAWKLFFLVVYSALFATIIYLWLKGIIIL